MRALLAKYDWPWTRDIYAEDFTRTANGMPRPWRVAEGAVTVDRTLGLRTVVPRSEAEQAAREQPQPREEQPRERGDSVRDMLGRILEEAVRPEGSSGITNSKNSGSNVRCPRKRAQWRPSRCPTPSPCALSSAPAASAGPEAASRSARTRATRLMPAIA
ncbi:MAG: hypothetical protein U5L11_12155 [Arhodomonas sp.]|nr:hypothetical protein [Arhodomonas sp.]